MDARVLLNYKAVDHRVAAANGSQAQRGVRLRPPPRQPAGTHEHIDDIGVRFMARLAGKSSLAATARLTPHLVNRLAEFMDDPAALCSAIDRIARNDKPGRDGLAFEVVKELAQLREQAVHSLQRQSRPTRKQAR